MAVETQARWSKRWAGSLHRRNRKRAQNFNWNTSREG